MALRVWLPLNGNLNNQGLTNWQFTNNNATVDNSGKIGKCYAFSGSSQYLRLNQKVIDTSQFTISFWMYATDVSANHCIFSTRNVTSGAVNIYLLSAGIRFDTSTTANWQTSFKPSANTWYHITLVQDATTKYLYVNGVLNNSTAGTTDLTQVSSVCTIGCEHINGSSIGTYFAGKLNDFRIYDHALSPKEIEILSRGLVCHYPLNGGGRGGDNLLKNTGDLTLWTKESGITTTWDSEKNMYKIEDSTHTNSRWGIYQDINVEANTSYTITVTLDGTACGAGFAVYDSSTSFPPAVIGTTGRQSYTLTSGANSTKARIYLYTNCGVSNVAWFSLPKVEKSDHTTPWMPNPADTAYSAMGYDSTTEYDVSGYGNNGTKNGTMTYLTDTARYNVSTKFADTTYIETSSPCSNVRSASFWIKTDKTAYRVAWADAKSKLAFGIVTAGDILISCNGGYTKKYPNSVIAANVWQHIVIVRGEDIANTDLYVNGVKQSPGTSTDYWSHTSDTLIINGRGYSTPSRMNSQMSDFRLYATALSATQVAELYNTAVSVANNGTLMGYELVEG